MDTSRLIINTIDKSSYDVENQTSVVGFTVVKAPKGPVYPVRVPAGGAAKLQDIFGVSSKDYPELFEVETFNKEYDVYVSAPYDGENTEVNVAYVTKDGIFPALQPVNYDSSLESVILGMEDDLTVNLKDKFNIDGSTADALKDFRFSYTNNLFDIGTFKGQKTGDDLKDLEAEDVDDGDIYLCDSNSEDNFFKAGKIYIAIESNNTLLWSEFGDLGSSESVGYRIYNKKSCIIVKTGIPYKFLKGKDFSFKINGFDPKYTSVFDVDGDTNKIYVKSGNSNIEVGSLVVDNYSETGDYSPLAPSADDDLITLQIIGSVESSIPEDVISNTYISSFGDESVRDSLEVFFVEEIKTKDIHGVICPKYASDRPIHISFEGFDDLIDYSAVKAENRNILKMTVYEDGAFRDASHKITVNGSLKASDTDSSGVSLGFVDSNASYSIQDLIYVYTVKEFTSTDSINTRISKYPSITIEGGKRSFIEDSIELHNLGWVNAKDNEFSDVDIFFSSEDFSGKSLADLRNSTYFTLVDGSSDGHNLGGYIFNYSKSPSEVDNFNKSRDYLNFGRNYWNVCNMAVISLSDGTRFFSTMTGAKALMQCRIIENRWGGVAPMWENEGTPGLGGQLDMINPLRLRYRYTKEQLDILDKFNYNPVINDRQYGIMVVGHKTCKPGKISDWSYIGHTCAFFNFIKEIRANVMIPQIGKANNPYYRDLRNKQVSQYLRDRLDGDNRIWAWAKVDTSTADGVNDEYARKALKFIINVSVRVDIFSEAVELNFTNEDQSSSVSFSDSYVEA